jgi:diguanylate cyclase (GGDEF)-like protein/PAS domain S-box-containing protein
MAAGQDNCTWTGCSTGTVPERGEVQVSVPPAFFEAAFDTAPVGMALLDLSGRWFRVNPALARMLGRSAEELLSADTPTLCEPEDLAADAQMLAELAAGAAGVSVEHRYRHRDGQVVWVRRRAGLVRDAAGLPEYVVAVYEDIGARREADARLSHLALHDPLTGLANRVLLDDRLTQAVAARDRDGGAVVVLFCDVDGLKSINDRHGHAFGDQILIAVAQRLTGHVRSGDTVARFGGDEFVVVCHLRAGLDASSMAGRLTAAVEEAPALSAPDGTSVPVRVSVGQEVARVGELDSDRLLRDADRSMYTAKRSRDAG